MERAAPQVCKLHSAANEWVATPSWQIGGGENRKEASGKAKSMLVKSAIYKKYAMHTYEETQQQLLLSSQCIFE